MVMEGDFVPGASTTKAKPISGYNEFAFPSVGGSAPAVVGGGDTVVMFKDSPASRALVSYLATPGAATIWAQKGGFSSPNKGVPGSAYPDALSAQDGDRARARQDLPLRHVRPRAVRLRRHGRARASGRSCRTS